MSSSAIPLPLFTVGDIALVDDTNRAHITEIRGEVNEQFFKVYYIIENRDKVNVTKYDIMSSPSLSQPPLQLTHKSTDTLTIEFIQLIRNRRQQHATKDTGLVVGLVGDDGSVVVGEVSEGICVEFTLGQSSGAAYYLRW